MIAAAALGVDSYVALAFPPLPIDVSLERSAQAFSWGPLTSLFSAVDWFEGIKQPAAAVVALVAVLIWNRRGFFLMLWGLLSGGAYMVIEMLARRPRPSADLVHVLRHTNGYSFPSGHVVFFTWILSYLLLILGRRYLPRPLYLALWGLVGIVVLAVAVGRVYTAEHWPTDVIAGLLLAIAWCALGISIRRLSDPVLDG